jgi:hypothetical protein
MILFDTNVLLDIATAFATASDLDRWLDPALFQWLPLPYSAGWLAAQSFLNDRRSGGTQPVAAPIFRTSR